MNLNLAIRSSFSLNHTLPYSLIAVQEMNLATRWNPLYWQCACLCINAGNSETDFSDDEEEDEESVKVAENGLNEVNNEIIDDSADAIVKKEDKRVAPNYGKVARAISDSQLSGVRIELPDINTSQIDFVPDIKNNSILYSLLAINVVNIELANTIIANRPYTSLEDFINRVQPTQNQIIGLIKAGCFDNLEKQNRSVIMLKYFRSLAEQEHPLKDKLTSVQLKKALELGLNLTGFENEIKLFKFKKYIDANQNDRVNKRYILNNSDCIRFFHNFIEKKLNAGKSEYGYLPDTSIYIKNSAFERVYKTEMETLMNHVNTLQGRKAYQDLVQDEFIKELKDKHYNNGNLSAWEMETMCFYHNQHELASMNDVTYGVKDFNKLPEYPEEIQSEKGHTKYKLCALAGTITDYNNAKHTISILTKYGIVDVKMFSGTYAQFNQKISKLNPITKKKIVIDDSWFKRGSKIIVNGYRKENLFTVKSDFSSGYNRTIGLIEGVHVDGSLDIRYTRKKK